MLGAGSEGRDVGVRCAAERTPFASLAALTALALLAPLVALLGDAGIDRGRDRVGLGLRQGSVGHQSGENGVTGGFPLSFLRVPVLCPVILQGSLQRQQVVAVDGPVADKVAPAALAGTICQ